MTQRNQKLLITIIGIIGYATLTGSAVAQPAPKPGVSILLNDLSAFKPATANWRVVGAVRADLNRPNVLIPQPGTGILANIPLDEAPADPANETKYNLFTAVDHGDIDLELDYLIGSKANSGVYLQGRYEVQLFDSWDIRTPKTIDNGSIYERWDPARGEGRYAYDGHPAPQNVSRAPGLWQHLNIRFQAPRFNDRGEKISNARLRRVELNGVLLHEDVELTGPTRAAAFADEKPLGPLMLQGDHGAVAFRNIRYDATRSQPSVSRNMQPTQPPGSKVSAIMLVRGFVDLPAEKSTRGKPLRISNAVSVGSPDIVHYTYDLDKGALVQVWRGNFLDTTQSGQGHPARPLGMVQRLGVPALFVARLASADAPWPADTAGSGYQSAGFVTDSGGRPTFRYQSFGTAVTDQLRVLPDGIGLRREVSISPATGKLYARLASGVRISPLEANLYLVDDQHYIRLDDLGGAVPTLRNAGERQELLVPLTGKIVYSILF